MSFASEQLYNGYLRTNMPTIVTKVKVRQIVVHLPCLTDSDREAIEAKREMCGNFNGMVLLLDCLKRRDSWPEHFIRALEKCQEGAMAAEIRAEYDKLLGAGDSTPSSPPTNAAMAHIHPAPPPSHPPGPETGSPSQSAAASPPSPAQADPENEIRTPAPAPETTPPPSPPRGATQNHPDHPEPTESSESDIADVQRTPEEVSFHCDATPEHDQAAESCEIIESPDDADVTDAPLTPKKPPVQDSAPPVEKIPLDDISEALDDTQIVVENCTAAGSTPASPASPDASSVFLSTARALDPNSDATVAGWSTEPYSGDTDRLEISKDQDENHEDEMRAHVSQPAVNGDAPAKEPASVREPASTTLCPETEKPAPRGALAANAKFVATAAGVGVCALLLAWKFKH
ncbi:mitochondrial antiviral-signaling protein [Hippocampus zosterae]|uniref:mitochondrial antiviral-signaling protein n=1 Tax=Hippocampus zosterae TaxID=109293 RepID=UPI00223DDF1F|nr:mitochondrial antiviral-signaling protein [Hippocampus zosterae]